MTARKKLNNPFVTVGYVSPEYFCDREKETGQIAEIIHSNRNLALISLRRMGKTGLLKHTGFLLNRKSKNNELIYIDLMPTQSVSDLLSVIGTALLQTGHSEKNILEKILAALASLRPGFSYDTLTGQPSLVLNVINENEFNLGFRQLLFLFSSIRKERSIVLDEFQQILRYPEKNVEHLLRTIVQENPQINFIFSGSDKHMMETMFNSPDRPFFQSVEMMYLGPIVTESYRDFIMHHFKAAGGIISGNTAESILAWCRNHTFYVQHFCNRLYAKGLSEINEETIRQVSFEILSSYEPLYLTYRKLLTAHQFALIQAIAVENGVSKPFSGDFVRKYSLNSASSVKTTLDALAGKEMIVGNKDGWQVYDVFFARWLEHGWKRFKRG